MINQVNFREFDYFNTYTSTLIHDANVYEKSCGIEFKDNVEP